MSRAFAPSGTDVAIPTLSSAPFHKKERLGGGSTDGAERAQSGSQVSHYPAYERLKKMFELISGPEARQAQRGKQRHTEYEEEG